MKLPSYCLFKFNLEYFVLTRNKTMHLSFPCHIRHKREDNTANEILGRSGSNVENNKIRDPEINEENPGKSL